MFCNIFNFILEIYIYIQILIRDCFKKKNFEINKIYLIGNKKYKIKSLIKNWDIIKELSNSINYVDIEYFYNNKIFKICFKYPDEIIFPTNMNNDIPFYQQVSEIITNNKELNKLINKYIQPNRSMNSLNITMQDICIINNINYNDNFTISNNFFKEKILTIHDRINL